MVAISLLSCFSVKEGEKTGLEGAIKYWGGGEGRLLIYFFKVYFSAPSMEKFYYKTHMNAVITKGN